MTLSKSDKNIIEKGTKMSALKRRLKMTFFVGLNKGLYFYFAIGLIANLYILIFSKGDDLGAVETGIMVFNACVTFFSISYFSGNYFKLMTTAPYNMKNFSRDISCICISALTVNYLFILIVHVIKFGLSSVPVLLLLYVVTIALFYTMFIVTSEAEMSSLDKNGNMKVKSSLLFCLFVFLFVMIGTMMSVLVHVDFGTKGRFIICCIVAVFAVCDAILSVMIPKAVQKKVFPIYE